MLTPLLIGWALLAGEPSATTPTTEDRQVYREEASKAGRDAGAHVRLAKWCAEHGLEAEGRRHLRIAVILDPHHDEARRLLGLDAAEGPEVDPQKAAALAVYNRRREGLADTVDGHWKMALWCEEQGLEPEMQAHLVEVLKREPKRVGAWKKLGFRKHQGRWMTPEQIAEEAEREAADKAWVARLNEIHEDIHGGPKQAEALKALAAIDDPRAVPAVYTVLGAGTVHDQVLAVQVLGQIDDPLAARGLAAVAVYGATAEIRRNAAESLRSRDPGDYLEALLSLLATPLEYEVKPVGGPGSPGVLFVEGEKYNVRRYYAAPLPPTFALQPGDQISYDASGLPVVNRFLGGGTAPVPVQFQQGAVGPPPDVSGLLQGIHNPTLAGAVQAIAQQEWKARMAQQAALAASSSSSVGLGVQSLYGARIPVGRNLVEAQRAARYSQQQLQADVERIKKDNNDREAFNAHIFAIAEVATGQKKGDDPESWRAWLAETKGKAYAVRAPEPPRQILEQVIPAAYQPNFIAAQLVSRAIYVPVDT